MASSATRTRQAPLPRLLRRRLAVGLEVGASALKVVALRPGKPPSLQHLGLRPTPPGVLQDDVILDEATLKAELGALFREAGIRSRTVATAVPNRLAITRNLQLPKMPLKDLQKAIPWEAERYIPFPIQEVAFDYFVLDHPDDVPDGGEVEVVVAATRLDSVTQLAGALRGAGLDPTVLDIKPFALLRALRGSLLGDRLDHSTLAGSSYTEDDEIGVVVEVAASSSTITLARGERVLMNRNLGVAGDDFSTALQRAFGLDFDSAEALKLRYGGALPPDAEGASPEATVPGAPHPERVYETLRPIVAELTTEIRRSLEFFRVQSGNAHISRLLLAGGGAKLRGLPTAVSRALNLRVELGNPWLTVLPGERFDVSALEALGPELGVPLGLALRGCCD
jgi:type IV pilus assembly protein PilM